MTSELKNLELEKIKKDLVDYFLLKGYKEAVLVLSNAEIESELVDIFDIDSSINTFLLEAIDYCSLTISIPLPIYIEIENSLEDLTENIKRRANEINFRKNAEITKINIVSRDINTNDDFSMLVEKLKAILIAKATGSPSDDHQYTYYRKILLSQNEIRGQLPEFLKICSNLQQFWHYIQPRFATYAERRQYINAEFFNIISEIEYVKTFPANQPQLDSIINSLRKLDSVHVKQYWSKALARCKSDPEGAITVAKTLVESTIKGILDEMGIEYSDTKHDLPDLYKLLSSKLSLAPINHAEKIFKKILGNCTAVIMGLGSIRNKISDAHGKGKKATRPSRRHAELAVTLGGAMSAFLIETWQNSKERDRSSQREIPSK